VLTHFGRQVILELTSKKGEIKMAEKSKKKSKLKMVVPFDEIVPLAVEMNGCKCMLYITDSKGIKKEISLDDVKELSVSPSEDK